MAPAAEPGGLKGEPWRASALGWAASAAMLAQGAALLFSRSHPLRVVPAELPRRGASEQPE